MFTCSPTSSTTRCAGPRDQQLNGGIQDPVAQGPADDGRAFAHFPDPRLGAAVDDPAADRGQHDPAMSDRGEITDRGPERVDVEHGQVAA